jgi:hypothetical protein
VDTAAIPFGKYDSKVIARLRKEGFRKVFTSDGGRTGEAAWLSARNSVRGDTNVAAFADLIRNGPSAPQALKRFISMSYRRYLA